MSQPNVRHHSPIQSRVEIITPDIALRYLKQNGVNRPFRRRLAERYAETIKRGAWLVNGEGLIFSSSNRLLDGQHRLHAIVMAGIAVEMLVVLGVENENMAFDTLNSGVRRSNSDRIGGRGEKYHQILASSLTWLYRYKHGPSTALGTRSVEPDELSNLLERHGGIRSWLPMALQLKTQAGFQASIMACLLYAAARQYPDQANQFYEQCLDGVNLTKSHPSYWLRSRVTQQSRLSRITPVIIFALAIKAWNAHVEGMDLHVLRFAPGSETFPKIVGFAPENV